MTFAQYWVLLRKQWKTVVLCCLLVGATAAVVSKLMKPIYQSAVLMQVVVGSGSDYNSLLASDQLVQTEAVLATSDSVLRAVASHYKALTAEQLAKEVTATPKINTQLFEIDVQDPSSTRAAELANDIAATLTQQQLQLMQRGTTQVDLLLVQPAQPGLQPVQPNSVLNTSAGLIIGLLFGLLLVLLLEQVDNRIRSPEAITTMLGLPVLATIWRRDFSRQEEYINPTQQDTNVEAYSILRANINCASANTPLKTLLITSYYANEGKSTIATNIAIFMAKSGKTTLIVDANLRRPMQHQHFGLPPDTPGLVDALQAYDTPCPAISPSFSQKMAAHPCVSHSTARSLEPFIHVVDIPNLWFMPAGSLPLHPAERLDSAAMHHVLTAIVQSGVEIVLFDGTLLGLSDVHILAPKLDDVLVVVDGTRANKNSLLHTKHLLTELNARVIGCVVNKQRQDAKDPIYSYDARPQRSNNEAPKKDTTQLPVIPITEDTPRKIFNGEGGTAPENVADTVKLIKLRGRNSE